MRGLEFRWDGSPATWRSFQARDDLVGLESTKRYNLAAWWDRFQAGKVLGNFRALTATCTGIGLATKSALCLGAGLGRKFPQLLRNRRQNKCGWPKL